MNDAFQTLWDDVNADIMRTVRYEPPDENIVAAVQSSIKTLLGSDHQYYLRMISLDSSRQTPKAAPFAVDRERHVHLIVGASPAFATDADVNLLQVSSETIFHIAGKHYKFAASDGGKQFHSRLADDLFLDVMKELEKISNPRFKVTWNYKTDLLFHVQTLAVAGFTQMHEDYRSHNSAEALLQRKKKGYRDIYAIKMGHGNAALDFSENFLKDLILKNVDEQLTCAELFHDLKLRCGDIFRDIKSVHASIMADLYLENKFEKYLHFIESYECHTKDTLESEAIKHFTEENRLFHMAEIKRDQIVNTMLEALSHAVKSCTRSNLIKKFLSKMDKLKITYSEAAAYLQLDIPNKQEFASIVSDQLNGRLKKSIRQAIRSWDVREKIKDRQLRKFIFKEIVGCRARCPFCKVPCDNHSSGKTGGKHATTVHRPEGLGGFHWEEDGRLTTQDCRLAVASQHQFRNAKTKQKWHFYKDYHKIYPDWTIHGEADPDFEKYWKWVFARHNREFARHYGVKEADVPPEWANYQKREIAEDMEKHYHMN